MTLPHLTEEQLNTYLDGECTEIEQTEALAHFALCEQCARDLQELSVVKHLLGQLDTAELPRSFVLPAEMAGISSLGSPAMSASAGSGSNSVRRFEPVARLLSVAAVLAFLFLGVGQMAGWIGDDNDSSSNGALISETDAPASALQEQEPAVARGELREQGDAAATGAGTLSSQPARVDTPSQVGNDLTLLELTTVGIGVIALVAIAGWILIHYRAGSAS